MVDGESSESYKPIKARSIENSWIRRGSPLRVVVENGVIHFERFPRNEEQGLQIVSGIFSHLENLRYNPVSFLRRLRYGEEEGGEGGYVTETTGRAEYIPLIPSNSPLLYAFPELQKLHSQMTEEQKKEWDESVGYLLNGMLNVLGDSFSLSEDQKEAMKKFGLFVKLKGGGPSSSQYSNPEHLLTPEYYEREHSIKGFTGIDRNDILYADYSLQMGFLPSRWLAFVVPIEGIGKVVKDPEYGKKVEAVVEGIDKWEEPLYLEVFVEFSGVCMKDLKMLLANRLMTEEELLVYADAVMQIYGFQGGYEGETQQEKKKRVTRNLITRMVIDVAITAKKFTGKIDNRTEQNCTLGGNQDWDDGEFKPDGVTTDEEYSETFFKVLSLSINNLQYLGILDRDEVMKCLNQLLEGDSGLSPELQEFLEECIAGCLFALDDRDRVEQMLEMWNRLKMEEYQKTIFLDSIQAVYTGDGTLHKVLDAVFHGDIQIDEEFRSKILSKIAYSSYKFSSCNNILRSLLGMQEWTMSDGRTMQVTDLGSDISEVYKGIADAVRKSKTIDNQNKKEILEEILSRKNLGSDRSNVLAAVAEAAGNISDGEEILKAILGMKGLEVNGRTVEVDDLGHNLSLVYKEIAYTVRYSETINDDIKAEILKEILSRKDLGSDRSGVLAAVAQAAGKFSDGEEILKVILGMKVLEAKGKTITVDDLGNHVSELYNGIAYTVMNSETIDNQSKKEILEEILSRKDLGSDRSGVLRKVAQAAGRFSGGEEILKVILGMKVLKGREGQVIQVDDLGSKASEVYKGIADAVGESETIDNQNKKEILEEILSRKDLGSDRSNVFGAVAEAAGMFSGGEEILKVILGMKVLKGREGQVIQVDDLGSKASEVYKWIAYAIMNSKTIDNQNKKQILKEILSRKDLGFDRSGVLRVVAEAAESFLGGEEILEQLKQLQ